jgi:hypothetical protein
MTRFGPHRISGRRSLSIQHATCADPPSHSSSYARASPPRLAGREVSGRVRETRLAKIRSFVHCVNKTMGFSFDNLPLEITCLKCGKQMNKTVKWLKAASQKCPSCDMVIDTAEFRRGVDEATNRTDEMIRNLENSLRSVKIKIHV